MVATGFRILPFIPGQLDDLIALSLRAWAPVFRLLEPAVQPFVFSAFYPQGWSTRQAADVSSFLREEGENAWVALDGDIALGWIGIRLHPADRMGEIHMVAVEPRAQRRGIASVLMDHAFREMRSARVDIVMVETGDDPGHEPARRAYERAGFERWPVARYFREL